MIKNNKIDVDRIVIVAQVMCVCKREEYSAGITIHVWNIEFYVQQKIENSRLFSVFV